MLIVEALAGTGKTTTSSFGLGLKVPKGMTLSDEQLAIVKLMRTFKYKTCAAMAFNKSIAETLKEKLAPLPGVEAATINAFGHRAWAKHITGTLKVDGFKVAKIFRELVDPKMNFKDRVQLESSVVKLVGLCKNNCVYPDNSVLMELCDLYDEEPDVKTFEYVARVFDKSLSMHNLIDYNDQLFLPVWYEIDLPKYDLVLVDELQDLNLAKQHIATRMGVDAIVGVGDSHQAIYGFSGADAEAMERYKKTLKDRNGKYGFDVLPLTITRRCPKEVVKTANRYVPEFRAADDAPDGIVDSCDQSEFATLLKDSEEGPMVLCRTNAPLAGLAFRLISMDRRCYIQGRDIGTGIKKEIAKTNESDLRAAVIKAIGDLDKRANDESGKPFPKQDKIDSLRDRAKCIESLSEGLSTVEQFNTRVDGLFKDYGSPGDVHLSTVHKAKGLENEHVYIYKPSKLPLTIKPKKGKAKTPGFQQQQEKNLAYVAYTRSMHRLTFVNEDTSDDDRE